MAGEWNVSASPRRRRAHPEQAAEHPDALRVPRRAFGRLQVARVRGTRRNKERKGKSNEADSYHGKVWENYFFSIVLTRVWQLISSLNAPLRSQPLLSSSFFQSSLPFASFQKFTLITTPGRPRRLPHRQRLRLDPNAQRALEAAPGRDRVAHGERRRGRPRERGQRRPHPPVLGEARPSDGEQLNMAVQQRRQQQRRWEEVVMLGMVAAATGAGKLVAAQSQWIEVVADAGGTDICSSSGRGQ